MNEINEYTEKIFEDIKPIDEHVTEVFEVALSHIGHKKGINNEEI